MELDLPSLRIVWAIIFVYFIALFSIGAWAKRRIHDYDSYFIGGRNLGAGVASLSYAATAMSAIMSTADSQLLVAASALSHDLMHGASLAVSRLFVLCIGVLAVIIAYGLPDAIFSRVLFAWNALGAAFGPVVIARLLNWKVSPTAVTWAVAAGFGLTVILHLAPNTPGDVAERCIPFATALAIVLAARGGKSR